MNGFLLTSSRILRSLTTLFSAAALLLIPACERAGKIKPGALPDSFDEENYPHLHRVYGSHRVKEAEALIKLAARLMIKRKDCPLLTFIDISGKRSTPEEFVFYGFCEQKAKSAEEAGQKAKSAEEAGQKAKSAEEAGQKAKSAEAVRRKIRVHVSESEIITAFPKQFQEKGGDEGKEGKIEDNRPAEG